MRRHFENKVNDQSESAFMMTQSPQMITSSTPLTAPAPTSPCFRGCHLSNELIQKSGLEVEKEEKTNWSNNNNIIINISTAAFVEQHNTPLLISDLGDEKKLHTAFELDMDNESVPFIDASSVQATPLRRQKLSAQQMMTACCNGTLKHLVGSVSSSSSISPLVRSNSLSMIDQTSSKAQLTSVVANTIVRDSSPIPRKTGQGIDNGNPSRTLATPEPRRHSVASFGNGPITVLGMRFRDRGCFSEAPDLHRKRTASNTAAAAVAKYSRQSRKERRATQTLAVVLGKHYFLKNFADIHDGFIFQWSSCAVGFHSSLAT